MVSELPGPGGIADAAVIERSMHEPDWFGVIFDRHFDAVFGYLARRTGRSAAEDLASATFTVAFERRNGFRRDATSARPWLFGIATNLLRAERRAERRALAAVGSVDVSGVTVDPSGTGDLAHIGRLLAALDPGQRDVLLLHAWEELSYEQIAEALEIPIGTVRSRLARARARLQPALHDSVEGAPEVA